MRKGRVFARTPTLRILQATPLVSLDGDHAASAKSLAKRGLQRRIVLTVPTFMMALHQPSSAV